MNRSAVPQRHATNVVSAVVFDYRAIDTLGEELVLFCAVTGMALLLRSTRQEDVGDMRDPAQSDALRAVGLAAVPVVVLLAIYVAAHGYVTPGGGFQGGVAAAGGLLLVYLAGEWRALRHAAPEPAVDAVHSLGAGAFVALGIATLAAGGRSSKTCFRSALREPSRPRERSRSANWCAGLEVTAAFVLVFSEFLTEMLLERKKAGAAGRTCPTRSQCGLRSQACSGL